MKNLYITLIIFMTVPALAQVDSSSCTAHDSIIAKYKTDAQTIALSRIYKFNSTYKDSAQIPAVRTDSIMRAIIAVYNSSFTQRDTIFNINNIHSRPGGDYYWLNKLEMYVDDAEPWVHDVVSNTIPTGNSAVNNLLTKYHFTSHTYFSTSGIHVLTLTSDSNYNMNAVGAEWVGIPGVYTGQWGPHAINSIVGDGDYITIDTVVNNYTIINFNHGWGDCPSGCICRANWKFKVYNNCGVEFMSSTRNCPPENVNDNIDKQAIQLYPNPFSDQIQFRSSESNVSYTLYNAMGVLVKKGIATNRIDTHDLNAGLYYLKLSSAKGEHTFKLVKE